MDQGDTCYDTDLFENQELDGLTCPIGLGVLRNPVFDQCGHVYCHGCITSWLDKSQLCPINKQQISKQQLIKALPIKGMIDNLQLKQCLKKCQWKGKLEQYPYHLDKDCPEHIVECRNPGCLMLVKRHEINVHMNNCTFKLLECEHCQVQYQLKDKEIHQLDCQGLLVECHECRHDFKKSEIIQHQHICEDKVVGCLVQTCETYVKKKELAGHLGEHQHIVMLQQQIIELKLQLEKQQTMIDQQKQIIPYLDGWRLSFSKKEESREWQTINSQAKLPKYFEMSFQVTNLNKRPNEWRALIGVASDKLQNNHLWYKQQNTYTWIFGGFKCCKGAEKYGSEVQHESFKGKMIVNRNNELIFEYGDANFGTAFVIDEQVMENGLYLILSFVNMGKIRITKLIVL